MAKSTKVPKGWEDLFVALSCEIDHKRGREPAATLYVPNEGNMLPAGQTGPKSLTRPRSLLASRRIYAGPPGSYRTVPPMTDITKPDTKDEIKVERPRLHKVILVNNDFTPRE